MSALAETYDEEFCPNCGGSFPSLDEKSGFCNSCTLEVVGVLSGEAPTPPKTSRAELWLQNNADIIESLMLVTQCSAKSAIKEIAEDKVVHCLCCGNVIRHATKDRHFICNKEPGCKKARRYYKYLVYEKGMSKDKALEKSVDKYKSK